MQHVRRFLTLLIALAVLLGAHTGVRAQDDSQLATHTVLAGETLYGIARQYNVTVDALAQANGLSTSTYVMAGQVLTVPLLPGAQEGQFPTAGPPPAQTEEIIHTVGVGETLFRIALQYNTTADALAQYNGIANPRVIYVGQQIRIPAGQALATPEPQLPADRKSVV